jgi:OOP family OmpA-OmpF porin
MTIGYVRTAFSGIATAMLLAASAPALAAAPDVNALARDLAQPTAPDCEKKLPDGSCPDTVDTRQLVLRGGAATSGAAVTRAVTKAVRQNISMTFEKGSAQLTAGARATLDRFAKALVSVSTYRPFTVEGHTDSSGTRETNTALSQARAQSVVSYLAAKGVDRSRMNAKGYGFDRPLKGVPADQPQNRRVEVSAP